MKVFLVEDSPLLRERLEALVASIPGSRTVGHAGGAQEALRAILAERRDVVVLDIHLSEGNGFDVLRGLREAAMQVDVLRAHQLRGRGLPQDRRAARRARLFRIRTTSRSYARRSPRASTAPIARPNSAFEARVAA